MNLSYCHEKLSLAIYEMCVSTQGLRSRLRGSIKHGFAAFPAEAFPEALREQFSEIKAALAGVRIGGRIEDYPDPIDRMRPAEVRRLIDKIISLRENVAKEYHRRALQSSLSGSRDNAATMEDPLQIAAQLLPKLPEKPSS